MMHCDALMSLIAFTMANSCSRSGKEGADAAW